jgi:hypothetical protein
MCLNDYAAAMAQIVGSKGHMHINFRKNGRMQDLFVLTGD